MNLLCYSAEVIGKMGEKLIEFEYGFKRDNPYLTVTASKFLNGNDFELGEYYSLSEIEKKLEGK